MVWIESSCPMKIPAALFITGIMFEPLNRDIGRQLEVCFEAHQALDRQVISPLEIR